MNGFIELRKHSVIHRDIKLSNIFINDGRILIGDFGISKLGNDICKTKIGTPLTMAPEMNKNN